MATTDNTIYVHFHVGRGGRFHNGGHLEFVDEKNFADLVSDYISDYYGSGLVFLNNMNEDESEYLPDEEWTVTESNGEVLLTGRDEIEAKTGILDFDGEYDTHKVYEVDDLDENEVRTILESRNQKSRELQEWLDEYCHDAGWDEYLDEEEEED